MERSRRDPPQPVVEPVLQGCLSAGSGAYARLYPIPPTLLDRSGGTATLEDATGTPGAIRPRGEEEKSDGDGGTRGGDLSGRGEAEPGRGRVPPGGQGGPRVPRSGPGEVPRLHRGEDHRADLRARAADDLPGALAGRPRAGADQPGLPGAVQQRPRAVQGGAPVPPLGLPRDHQVPRVRADLQELPDRAADRRGQGGVGLRPEGEVGQRGDAVLPELHDGAVADHRRAHGRPRGRHRGGRPRDRLPVRAVQAPHEQVRGGGPHGEGAGLRRQPGAHRGDRATAAPTSSRRC